MPSTLDLTSYATAFVGREKELEALHGLLAKGERLVTILGPGGVGKTRLAMHLAVARAERGHAAHFCDLSDAATIAAACSAVARVFEVPLSGAGEGETIAQLGRTLATRGPMLVVLDNFEQLVERGSSMLASWLSAAPKTLFVVTSRARLRLPSECCFDLAPLALPDEGETDPMRIAGSDAVRLFVERAGLARSGFVLEPRDAPAAAAIVRTLDGMPLAIELCAVRAGMLGVTQLLELLPRHLDALGQGPRTGVPRHATLRRTIDWSWEHLTGPERDAIAACSVFRGGWNLAAAEQVIGEDALDLLQALYDKSLVRTYEPAEGDGERRYGLYESIRAYAAERLEETGRGPAVRQAHVAHFLRAYGGPHPEALVHGEVKGNRRLLLDLGNMEAIHERACRVSPKTASAATEALQVLVALAPIYATRGPLDRYEDLLREALESSAELELDPGLRGQAFASRGWVLHLRGRNAEAIVELSRAAEHAILAGDIAAWGLALGKYACAAALLGDLDAAQARFDEVMTRFATARVAPRARAQLLREHAFFCSRQGDSDQARRDLEASLVLFRQAGARRDEGLVLSDLAGRAFELGELELAAEHSASALEIAREVGDRRLGGSVLLYSGSVALEQNALDRARLLLEQAVIVAIDLGFRLFEAISRQRLGDVELMGRAYEKARAHYVYAEMIHKEGGDMRHSGLCVAARGVALAHLGRADEAAVLFERAVEQLGSSALPTDAEVIELYGGHLHLAAAREAMIHGDQREARACQDRARSLLVGPEATSTETDGARAKPDEVRFARALLERHLEDFPSRYLAVDPTGAWFQLDHAERVQLGNRILLKNLLAALVRQHELEPGTSLDLEALFRFGWPGEKIRAAAAANRTKVALTMLRKLGLRDVLQTHEGGYRLDPSLAVVVARTP